MVKILARTYHVAYGVPPRRFAVTFEIGGDRRVEVVSEGARLLLAFNGRGYRPGSEQQLTAVIEKFMERLASDGPLERVNAELLHPDNRRERQTACGDRQLPASDRA